MQVIICIRYGILKKGFFVDELWGAGLANSYFRPRLFTPGIFNTNRYLPGSFFYNYLTVSQDEGCSLASVWYNQSQDSHPPLYFLLYHILSCIKPGTFSKWTGLLINLVFLVGTNIYVFLTGTRMSNRWAGLAASALWGFSAEAVSYTLCARMYMMAAFFIVLFFYRTLSYYELHGENNWKTRIYLMLATTGGCLTHYYFYIGAFVLAAITCTYLYLKKGFRRACSYGFVVLGGVFLSWVIYPLIFVSLAHGDGRGREAIKNLLDLNSLWARIGALVKQIEAKLLYRPVLILVLVVLSLIVIIVILSILWKEQLNPCLKSRISMLLVTETAFVLYMLTVAKLQPFNTNRYYFPITPLLWIIALGNLIAFKQVLFTHIKRTDAAEKAVLAVMMLFLIIASSGVVFSHIHHKVMFLFPRQEQILDQIKQGERHSALFIAAGKEYTITAHCLELAQCSEAMCLDIGSEANLSEYDIHDEGNSLLVLADETLDQQKLVDQILKQTAYSTYSLIGRGSGVWWEDVEENYIYFFSK